VLSDHAGLSKVVAALRFACYEQNKSTGVLRRNKHMFAMFDVPEEDYDSTDTAEKFAESIHPDDAPRVLEDFYACIAGKTPTFDSTYRVNHRDGKQLILHSHGEISTNSDGTER
jgi:PAS domain-containing protein